MDIAVDLGYYTNQYHLLLDILSKITALDFSHNHYILIHLEVFEEIKFLELLNQELTTRP